MIANKVQHDLIIVRTFDAPASVLFALWTEPAHFSRWMGPADYRCIEARMDCRAGGAYRGMIRDAKGDENWFGGVYQEVTPFTRLAFTWAWDGGPVGGREMLITITFEERDDGKTVQTFHQANIATQSSRDSHEGGWTKTFEKLAAYAAGLAAEGGRG